MKLSCGILLFKRGGSKVKVLLLHPGGPIWGKRDFWTVPKGELDQGEDELLAAKREFSEETGFNAPKSEYIDLGEIKQNSTKTNHIWAAEGDTDIAGFSCNNFTMEWPPKSGKMQSFPECDRAEWFSLEEAKSKLFANQVGFIDKLEEHLSI